MKKVIQQQPVKRLLSVFAFLFLMGSFLYAQPQVRVADGFATGTTGGGNATAVEVSTAADLRTEASKNTPSVVHVKESIDLGSTSLQIGSSTTVLGLNSNVTITGCFEIKNKTNIIIQNLNITNPNGAGTGDGIEVSGSTYVFITNCSFSDCADGSIDIVRAADFVTVSWCKFSYPNQTQHNFVNLIGNGDNVFTDRGKLRVSMHHNWYHDGCKERMPRVRFGQVHIYNTYYGAANNNYNIGVGNESQILVENSYFDNQKNAWKNYSTSTAQGIIQWRNLHMQSTATPTWAPNSTVFEPPYLYTLDDADKVKAIVMAQAGNVLPNSSSIGQTSSIKNKINIYPNPITNGIINVEIKDITGESLIKLTDIAGRNIYEKINFGNTTLEIPVSLTNSIYILTLIYNGVSYSQKIINAR
jgi:pectate lyase